MAIQINLEKDSPHILDKVSDATSHGSLMLWQKDYTLIFQWSLDYWNDGSLLLTYKRDEIKTWIDSPTLYLNKYRADDLLNILRVVQQTIGSSSIWRIHTGEPDGTGGCKRVESTTLHDLLRWLMAVNAVDVNPDWVTDSQYEGTPISGNPFQH